MSEVYKSPLYASMSEYERDLFEERAAIREYDGGEIRWVAESGALRDILENRWNERGI